MSYTVEIIMTKLKRVLEEKHISSFKNVLELSITELSTEAYTWDFSNYLMENYLQNREIWPSKDDVYKDIKFNFHLERMHKTLKHLFLNGKNAKQFGKALGDIMRFIKDKLFDRTILINRGKINNKMKIAIFRHKLSLHCKEDEITRNDEEWQIPSSETGEIYKITEIQPSCRCEFICPQCKTCIHRFVCTCLDSLVKWNMCKHIHILCRYLNSPENTKQQTHQLTFIKQQHSLEDCSQHQSQQLIYVKRPPEVEYCKPTTSLVEYVKEQSPDVRFIKEQPQQIEHLQIQHIQVENHVGHVDQVEGTYIYCNETNQREMDAILAEVNICNLETVQVTQIPRSCTIQIPTSCRGVPQVAQINDSYEGVVDTKESLKMKFLKVLEEASSPSELEVVQKMLASITPTLEVIKGGTSNHQVLFPL